MEEKHDIFDDLLNGNAICVGDCLKCPPLITTPDATCSLGAKLLSKFYIGYFNQNHLKTNNIEKDKK